MRLGVQLRLPRSDEIDAAPGTEGENTDPLL